MNLHHSRILIEEILRHRLEFFILSPGSRNAPLSLSVADARDADVWVHPDERSAAFVATGYARAIGKPAVLICTSGTAVANYLPAVVEASQSELPLLMLTADRPAYLRNTGAPQTIIQPGIFKEYTRFRADLNLSDENLTEAGLRNIIRKAISRTLANPPGPVHLNCQFDEPLLSPDEIKNYAHPAIDTEYGDRILPEQSLLKPDKKFLSEVISAVRNSRRGVIIAGPTHPFQSAPEILRLAEHWQMPLLADVTSNLRFCGKISTNLISTADLIFRRQDDRENFRPDLILQFGNIPVSRPFFEYIRDSQSKVIQVEPSPHRKDPFNVVDLKCQLPYRDFCRYMEDISSTRPSELLKPFTSLENRIRKIISGKLIAPAFLSEPAVAYHLLKLIPDGFGLYLANSMPVRDADAFGFCREKRLAIGINRGASGIDGTIASAVGFARGLRKPCILLTGDLAFFHDLNSLRLVKNLPNPLIIIVINNNGGGIFSFLPLAEIEKHFEEVFAAPQNMKFSSVSQAFGLDYHNPVTIDEFIRIFNASLQSQNSAVIEINTHRNQNREIHEKLWSLIRD